MENAFGILAAKWRVFRRPITIAVESVDKVVRSCCCLHNYLRHTANYCTAEDIDSEDRMGEVSPGAWRENTSTALQNLPRHTTRGSNSAAGVREMFADYFANEGALLWQSARINRVSY